MGEVADHAAAHGGRFKLTANGWGLDVMKKLFCALVFAALLPAADAAILDPTVDGNRLVADIDLGTLSAELAIEFEDVVGLSVANLGLSAELVNPTDPALLARLAGTDLSPAAGFPVLVRIQPPASGGLAFEGLVDVTLYTHDLHYTVGTPLRLFSAPDGGMFRDITAEMSSGSYRVRGSKGTFSEFLIVADLRATATAVDAKFTRLADLLYGHAGGIDPLVFSDLEAQLATAEAAWDDGDVPAAIAGVEDFAATVKGAAGIPNVWRSARDLDNVAGELRAAAATLRFSLTLASNGL